MPHLGSHRRHHSHHQSPRGKVVTIEANSDEEVARVAKRSAELSTSPLREAENDTAEKIASRTAGGLAAVGGEGVPTDAGSPSVTAPSVLILPTVETGEKSSLAGTASVVTNIAKTPECRLYRLRRVGVHQCPTSPTR